MAAKAFQFDGTPKSCATFLRSHDYVSGYKKLLADTAAAERLQENEESTPLTASSGTMFEQDQWSFDQLITLSKQFHLMTPLVFESEAETLAVTSFLALLKRMGMKPISLEDLQAKRQDGLMACRCPSYLKNAWCKHSMAFAIDRKIIQFPKYKDPTLIMKVGGKPGGKGGKRKIRRGNAWGKD
jgi:hypothetical protein